MNKYEAMFVIKPDLKDEEKSAAMKGIKEQVVKQEGRILQDQVWAERRKLAYEIFGSAGQGRFKEGMYYLLHFESGPGAIDVLKNSYGLNENILRFLILRLEDAGAKA